MLSNPALRTGRVIFDDRLNSHPRQHLNKVVHDPVGGLLAVMATLTSDRAATF